MLDRGRLVQTVFEFGIVEERRDELTVTARDHACVMGAIEVTTQITMQLSPCLRCDLGAVDAHLALRPRDGQSCDPRDQPLDRRVRRTSQNRL